MPILFSASIYCSLLLWHKNAHRHPVLISYPSSYPGYSQYTCTSGIPNIHKTFLPAQRTPDKSHLHPLPHHIAIFHHFSVANYNLPSCIYSISIRIVFNCQQSCFYCYKSKMLVLSYHNIAFVTNFALICMP